MRLHDVAASVLVKADTDYTHVCAVFSFRSAYDLGIDDPRLYHLQNKVRYIDDGEMTLIVSFAKQSALYQRRGVEWIGGGGGPPSIISFAKQSVLYQGRPPNPHNLQTQIAKHRVSHYTALRKTSASVTDRLPITRVPVA